MNRKIECLKCIEPIVHSAFIVDGEYICLDCFKKMKIKNKGGIVRGRK